MASRHSVDAIEIVYGAVVGGLISSFAGITVFSVFMETTSETGPPVTAAIIGLVFAALLMAGGVLMAERAPWMGTSLLFASGFTALWSVALSLSLEQRWVTLLVLGAVIVAGVFLGRWRFGRDREPASCDADAPVPPPSVGDPDE